MNGNLHAKEVNLGQDCTAEPGTTAAQGTGQIAEGTAMGVAEAIPVTIQHQEDTTDLHSESATEYPIEATDAVQPLTATCTIKKAASIHYTLTA